MNEAILFYLFSGLTVLAALYVVLTKNPTYAVLSLVAAMFCLALLFVLLRAYFIAAVHILVYAGAILVLFLFVVMLLGVGREENSNRRQMEYRVSGGLVIAGFLTGIGLMVKAVSGNREGAPVLTGTIEEVGKLLFNRYWLPFEITSILLLVGIIGAVVLSRKEQGQAGGQ